jgi:ankyrin repeat protein
MSGDFEHPDDWGDTLLAHAARIGNLVVARYLLENQAQVNSYNENRTSVLHHGVYSGSIEMVLLLLTYGANLEMEDVDQEAPMDTADEAMSDAVNTWKMVDQRRNRNTF